MRIDFTHLGHVPRRCAVDTGAAFALTQGAVIQSGKRT